MAIRSWAGKALKALRVARQHGLHEVVSRTLRHFLPPAHPLSPELLQRLDDLTVNHDKLADSIRCLAWEQARSLAQHAGTRPIQGPLVSIVMPAWNRQQVIAAAIDSVLAQTYANWELLIVDDGSSDQTCLVVEPYLRDGRIQLIRRPHQGVSAARNQALSAARGEFVAYLDSDNQWYPYYLATVVTELRAHPDRDCVYLAQLVENVKNGHCHLRFTPFDRERFARESCIDLNSFVHRRALIDRDGGFDERLTRLVDWDQISRCTKEKDPLCLSTIGGVYYEQRPDSISEREDLWLNYYRVRRKLDRPIEQPLRALYALWHYPHLTESYMRAELLCMKRWGVEIAVWAEMEDKDAPYESEVPAYYGSLADAIQHFRPHVVHVHWLNCVPKYRDAVARAGLPLTVRGHGFDFDPSLVENMQGDPIVQRMYLYPHFAVKLPSATKVCPMKSAFHGDLYYPAEKDRRLVIRTGSALPSKDLKLFIDVARACPQHRFVLVLGRATNMEGFDDELIAYNRSLGNPVEIHVNLQQEEVSALVRKAGIYLHTFGFQAPFGMPMSICEAMATGAYVLARSCPESRAYIGQTGAFYDTADQAAKIIGDTLEWPESVWREKQRIAVEHAYEHHADVSALRPILTDWLRLARGRAMFAPGSPNIDGRFDKIIDHFHSLGLGRVKHHQGSFLSHAIGIGWGLASWGCDFDVCAAGLTHSLYGTEKGGSPIVLRDDLRRLIGVRAEQLVYWNCVLDRKSLDEALAQGGSPYRLRDRHSGHEFAVDPADFADLCRIQLADWLEQLPRCEQWHYRGDGYRRMAELLGGAALAAYQRVRALADAPASHPLVPRLAA